MATPATWPWPDLRLLPRARAGGRLSQWVLRGLARHEHHGPALPRRARTLPRQHGRARRLEAVQIDSELGTVTPGQPRWDLTAKLALCAATTHVSLIRPLQLGASRRRRSFAIATRNCLRRPRSAACCGRTCSGPSTATAGDQGTERRAATSARSSASPIGHVRCSRKPTSSTIQGAPTRNATSQRRGIVAAQPASIRRRWTIARHTST